MGWFFGGRTGYAFLDVWSIVHFCFWVYAGSVLWPMQKSRPLMMVGCLVGAYAWEVFERFAEKKWPKLWLNPESWWNAYLSDPLMCVLGVLGVLFVWYALDHWRVP